MSLRRELYERQLREHEAAAVAAERERRRVLVLAVALCVLWTLLGLACMAWGLHTAHRARGELAFSAGLLVGNGGVLLTVFATYLWFDRRGYGQR